VTARTWFRTSLHGMPFGDPYPTPRQARATCAFLAAITHPDADLTWDVADDDPNADELDATQHGHTRPTGYTIRPVRATT